MSDELKSKRGVIAAGRPLPALLKLFCWPVLIDLIHRADLCPLDRYLSVGQYWLIQVAWQFTGQTSARSISIGWLKLPSNLPGRPLPALSMLFCWPIRWIQFTGQTSARSIDICLSANIVDSTHWVDLCPVWQAVSVLLVY